MRALWKTHQYKECLFPGDQLGKVYFYMCPYFRENGCLCTASDDYRKSCADARKSSIIARAHRGNPGYICPKEYKNHCSVCTQIRHYTRLLRHHAGICHKSRKCPACEWLRLGQKWLLDYYDPRAAVYKLYRLKLAA